MAQSLDELLAHAEIGEEARKFLAGDLGRCLVGMADQRVLAAQIALESVDPTDTEKIRELQNQAHMGRDFGAWLAELVSSGEEAMAQYKQNRS